MDPRDLSPRHPSLALRVGLLIGTLLVGTVAAAVMAAGGSAATSAFSQKLVIPPVLTGSNITLTAAQTNVQVLPGAKTRMWTYNGTFPGPTIRRPTGQTTQVTLVNKLPAAAGEITLHNHGNHSVSASDGQPDDLLAATGGGRVTTPTPGPKTGTTSAAPCSGITTIGWTRPAATSGWAWPACTSSMTRPTRRPCPRVSSTCRS